MTSRQESSSDIANGSTSPRTAADEKPLTDGEAKETRQYLESSQLPSLLEDFTLAVAKQRPKDVVAFMSQWAQQRSHKAVLARSETLSQSLDASPKKPVLFVLVGLDDRDDMLEDLDVDEEDRSEHLKTHVRAVRTQLKLSTIQSYSFAALESDNHTFVVVNLEIADAPLAPTPLLMTLLNQADGLLLKISCDTAMRDFQKRREGLLYHQVLCAHACQVKNAIVLMTNSRTVTEAVVNSTITETQNCLYTSGYKKGSVPILRFPDDAASGRLELTTMASSLPFVIPRSRPRYYDQAHKIEAKVMVLDSDGLSVGESLLAFCKSSFHCRVDAVLAVLDKSTGKVKEKKPFQIKCGDAGLLTLSIVNGAEVVKDAHLILTKGNRVAAFGHITLVESEEDDTDASTEDFALSDE